MLTILTMLGIIIPMINYSNTPNIAIIPARSGSKGLKDKNVKILNSKPLIAYTIDAAIQSNLFDRIIVSTDSVKYAQIAKTYGADVPFLRSKKNSKDKSTTWDVVNEVLSKIDKKYNTVVLLQPTSPLRTAEDIKNAYTIFTDKNADSVVSVCETEHPPYWCNTLNENLSMKNFVQKKYQIPRQLLPKQYIVNGAIYIVKTNLLNNPNLYGKNSYAYIMNKINSVDIDDITDFLVAEQILKLQDAKI